jgi:hypothetical protein
MAGQGLISVRLPRRSGLGLFGHIECVVHLDAEVPDGTFELRMTEQQLYRAEVFRPAVGAWGRRLQWTT